MNRDKFFKLGVFFTRIKLVHPKHDSDNDNNCEYIYSKTTKDMILDSLLVALVVFIASLPMNNIPTLCNLYDALRGFLYYFIVQLIIDRAMTSIAKNVKKVEGEKK